MMTPVFIFERCRPWEFDREPAAGRVAGMSSTYGGSATIECAGGVPRTLRREGRVRRAPHSRMGYAPWGTPQGNRRGASRAGR